MADVDLVADRAIMAFVRDSRRARGLTRVGQFLLMFTAATKHRYLNYAIPDDDADPSAADLDLLVEAFRNADRMPRLEFLPTVAPALEARLLDHGFSVEERLPLMTCTRTSARRLEPPEGVRISVPFDDATMLAMASLQHDIFDDPEPADASSVARLRFGLERGARALVAVDGTTGATAGAAQCVPPAGGATEVVGVAVAPSHRRRGLAAAMVSALVTECFDAGLITVFLEAAPGADGAYRNAGFVRTSTSVHISLEEEGDA
ncbi:MAG TPA: GNAT family N-acetyltransferase [Candidatus Dormibacteraeota bacterium]|jgi:ribosomal protein S18 acetylase RimI-like enzyme